MDTLYAFMFECFAATALAVRVILSVNERIRREDAHLKVNIRILERRSCRTLSTEGRTTSPLTFPADVWDGGPFGERCCQPRQTAAPGSAPDLTETSPSISHVIWVSEGVCALLAVTLTRRHKLFLSRCSLMHLSLIPPPYNNTKTNTCLPCSNYTCTHTLTVMCIMHFTKRLVNVKQRQTPLYFPLLLLLLLSFLSFLEAGVHTDRDCCCEAERDRANVVLCKDGVSLWSGGRWGQLIGEPALEWRAGLEEFIKLPKQLAYGPNYHMKPILHNQPLPTIWLPILLHYHPSHWKMASMDDPSIVLYFSSPRPAWITTIPPMFLFPLCS